MGCGGGGAGAGKAPFGVGGFGVPGLSPPLLSEPGPEGFLTAPGTGAGVEEAEEWPLLGLTGSFLWFTSPFSFGGGVRGRMPFWWTGDEELLLLLPVSSFFIFLASLGPLLLGVAAEAAEVGELGLLLSLTLLACDAEPGLRAEDDLSRGDSEVRFLSSAETDLSPPGT